MHKKQVIAIVLANIVVSALVAWLTWGWVVRRSTTQQSVAAREFLLLDEAGHVGAKLSWEDRQPGMRLFDRQGHVRAALFLEPNGVPDFYLYDQNQVERAALNLFDSGVPNLAFLDADQQHMVWTDFDKNHVYNITFVKLSKGSAQSLGSRHMTGDGRGVHESDTLEEHTSH